MLLTGAVKSWEKNAECVVKNKVMKYNTCEIAEMKRGVV